MSVIIRLQNLPWSANSLDIRHYFRGLSIPEGGVHIVGGEMGDAFIAFSTDEDARQAMMLTGGKIKEVQISLMLSSRSEMQKIIEAARAASMSSSLAQLLVPPAISLAALQQQQQQQPSPQMAVKDPRMEKKDSSDVSSSSHEMGSRRDRRDRSRSRSRERGKKDRKDRDRDRDRDRRRRSRSRSRSRERRRRRSRSRSRGPTRERDRKEVKEDIRKDNETVSNPIIDTPVPNILNPNTWMQPGALAQTAQLLPNFELLRSLANQKGPLIQNAPPLLPTPVQDKTETKTGFQNRQESPGKDFDQSQGNQRGFNNFEDGNFQENMFRGERFPDPTRNQFGSGFPVRNGNEPLNNTPRFRNFGRGDNGFLGRGLGPNRDRGNPGSRGILDFPSQRDDQNRQDKFSNKNEDKVDEFGRSIQLRNRKNAAQEEAFKEDNNFQGNQQNFQAFRFGNPQNQAQRPPPLLRGRNWTPGGNGRGTDNFQERRVFRGGFDDPGRGGFRQKGNRESFSRFQEENDQGNVSETDCCVEIRNLSPHIAYGEVRRPFSNLKLIIKEIKFFDYNQTEKKCRIRFLNSENKKKAMQMSSKIVIDRKQVHLCHINDCEFDECLDEGVKRPEIKFSDDEDDLSLSPKDAYVLVKDLGIDVEESDIAGLFPDTVIDKIVLENDGKSKSAYIKFQNPVDAKVALGTPNRNIGDSVVFLTPLPQHVFNDHLNKAGRPGETELEPIEVDLSTEEVKNPTSCILMKNLPLEANDRDICDFFSDVGLVPTKIHLMLDMAEQPSGDAFCEFLTPAQVERACSKNSAHLGKNIVTVCQISRSEMLEALGVVQNENYMSTLDSQLKNNNAGTSQCILQLENIPFRAGPGDIINFFGWSYKLTEHDILRRYNERGQPTGDAKVCFRSPEDALRALRFMNNRTLNGRAIRMKPL